jgi:Rieske Fe-S protein
MGDSTTVGVHEAQAYRDPGTPEEQSRRTFLANATIGIGGIIGLVIAVPVIGSLIPDSLLNPDVGKGTWTPLTAEEYAALQKSTNDPVSLKFSFQYTDGYLTSTETQTVWGVKLTPEQESTFKAKRPDIYDRPGGEVPYPAVTMSFVIFSSICPHLGCTYDWNHDAKRFICPCHGSQYSVQGEYLAGPAPRGLDPLPFREAQGKAEITWIVFKTQQPTRLIVAYS